MKKTLIIFIIFAFCNSYCSAQKSDSLYAKRVFLATYIYKDGAKLSNKKILQLFKNTPQSKIKYHWSSILKPIGPVVAVGGVGLAYIALKGKDATALVEGKAVDYKIRSLPKLLIGLGLVVGGLSMVESSNELTQNSVNLYNSSPKTQPKVSGIDNIKFGITQSNGIGFTASLK